MFHVDELWLQAGLDALEETFRVGDDVKRDMIQFLFDEGFWNKERLTWAAAVARFNDCLNPNKAQFFKVSELWALMKAFDRHTLLQAMADDLGYQRLRQLPSAERRQALLERIARAEEQLLATIGAAKRELAELDAPSRTPRIHPGIHEHRGAFSVAEPDEPNRAATCRGTF